MIPSLVKKFQYLRVAEPPCVAIEESEMGALAVQIGMNVVLLGDGGELAVVKQPDGQDRPGDTGESRLVARADAVDMFVEAIVEEVVAVAAAGIGGADPDRTAGIHVGIGAPGHLFVSAQPNDARQIIIPALVNSRAIRAAVFGQEIVILGGEYLRGQPPLFEIVKAVSGVGLFPGAAQGGQEQRRQNGDQGDHDQQLDERESHDGPVRRATHFSGRHNAICYATR